MKITDQLRHINVGIAHKLIHSIQLSTVHTSIRGIFTIPFPFQFTGTVWLIHQQKSVDSSLRIRCDCVPSLPYMRCAVHAQYKLICCSPERACTLHSENTSCGQKRHQHMETRLLGQCLLVCPSESSTNSVAPHSYTGALSHKHTCASSTLTCSTCMERCHCHASAGKALKLYLGESEQKRK